MILSTSAKKVYFKVGWRRRSGANARLSDYETDVPGTPIRWLLNNYNKKLLEFSYCRPLESMKKEINRRKMLFYSLSVEKKHPSQQASNVSLPSSHLPNLCLMMVLFSRTS